MKFKYYYDPFYKSCLVGTVDKMKHQKTNKTIWLLRSDKDDYRRWWEDYFFESRKEYVDFIKEQGWKIRR
jgi:hypothetical protein